MLLSNTECKIRLCRCNFIILNRIFVTSVRKKGAFANFGNLARKFSACAIRSSTRKLFFWRGKFCKICKLPIRFRCKLIRSVRAKIARNLPKNCAIFSNRARAHFAMIAAHDWKKIRCEFWIVKMRIAK